MRRRYYIVAVCLLVMSFLLTACGGKEKDKKVIHIQIAYENNTDEPLSKACEKWKELLEEKSNGEFQVDLYPSSQLGTKNDIINQAIAGDSVITLANGAFYSDLGVKDFGVVFAPYLFRSWDDIEKLAQSDWWEKQEQNVKNQTGLTIVGGASAFAWVLTKERIPQQLTEVITSSISNKYVFLIIVILFLLVVGMFIEGNAAMIVLVPLLAPVAQAYGINEIHFAMLFIFVMAVGGVTPPMGTLIFVTCGVTKCDIKAFIKESMPFYIMLLILMLGIAFIPALSTGLVNLVY